MNLIQLMMQDYTLQIVSLGAALLGIVSGMIGSFAVLRKQSLIGDAISHAALPGIAVAFLIIQTKNTYILLLGALISGLIATWIMTAISKYSPIKYDSALAFVLSVFFGGGLMLLTYIQKIPNANQAGLDTFIFGQASTLLKRDIQLIMIVGVISLVCIILFWKAFKLLAFDPAYGDTIGFSSKKISALLSALIVLAIIIGLQTVGVILMSAMLIAPGVAARQWTNRLSIMVILSALFGAISGVTGTLISSSIAHMPTGPTIVIVVTSIVMISLLFAPNRGIIWRKIHHVKNQTKLKTGSFSIKKDLVIKEGCE